MATEVSELLALLRLKDETAAGLASANAAMRKTADEASKAENAVQGLGAGVKVADTEFKAAGRSISTINKAIDGQATAAAAANRVLRQHADAVEKVRIQAEREGKTAAQTAEALRRLDVVRDNGLAKARAAGARVEAQFLGTGAATQAAGEQLGRFGSVADQVQRSTEGMASRLGVAGVALSSIGVGGAAAAAALAGIGGALAVVARAGDQAVATMARLNVATGNLASARDAYQQLYNLSQQTGVAVADAAGAFVRFRVAAGEIGATNSQVVNLVAGLQKAAIISGATGQETSSAMMQLGQALAAGTLQGEELRSIMEGMPPLAQALAQELGVSLGELRALGAAGQLTADRVFPALLRATEKMGADFDRMPLTMSRSFGILGEAMTNFAENLDHALGVSEAIARAVKAAADAVNVARRAAMPTPAESAQSLIDRGTTRRDNVLSRISGAQADIDLYRGAGLTQQEAIDLAVPVMPGVQSIARELAEAEAMIRRGLQSQMEISAEFAERQNQEIEAATAKATSMRQVAAQKAIDEDRLRYDKIAKLSAEHGERMATIAKAEAEGILKFKDGTAFDGPAERLKAEREYQAELKKLRDGETRDSVKTGRAADTEVKKRQGVIDKLKEQVGAAQAAHATTQAGTADSREMALALDIENNLRAAGIPAVEQRTAAEQEAAAAIAGYVTELSRIKNAEQDAAKARAAALAEVDRFNREVESQSREISRDVSTNIFDAITDKSREVSVLDFFRTMFRRIAIQALSANIILPITTAVVGGAPGLFGIASPGQAGGSALSGLGSMFGLGDIAGSLGLTGPGGMFGGLGSSVSGFLGTSIISPMGGTAMGPLAEIVGASSGATIGSLLGGAGAGFGAGMFLNSLLGGNQTSGMIGSGAGGLAGAAIGSIIPGIGTLLGGLIGGAAGGGLGGLIGPNPTSNGFSYTLRGDGENLGAGVGGQLLPIDRQYYNEQGASQFAQAEQAVAALNAFMAERGLTVQGARAVGGNKNGMGNLGYGEAASFGEALASLKFGAADNELLGSYLGGQTFDDPAKLQAAVDGFLAAQAAIEALGAEAVPAFTRQLDAINASFDAAAEQAKKYGLAEDNLTTARAEAIAALESQRTETLRQSDVALSIRRLAAGGNTQQAELARQAEDARLEMDAFGQSLEALAITAEDRARRLVELEEVQAAERAEIIARYGEQANAALRQAGGNIRAYLDNLRTGTAAGASPYDRLIASQATYKRDQTLASGGDRDALGRVTGSADAALSAARDYFASGAGFEFVKNQVVSGLTNLPVVQSYDAMMTASLEAIQAAFADGSAEVGISPGANVVTIAGLSTSALETIGRTQINLLSQMRVEAFTIAEVAHAITAGIHASLYEIGSVTHAALAVNNEGAAIGNQFLAVIAAIGQATNDNLALSHQIATDASAANVFALAAGHQIAADASAASVSAASLGHQIAVDSNAALIAALNLGNQIATDASAANVAAHGVGHQIAADIAAAQMQAFAAGHQIAVDASAANVAVGNLGNIIAADAVGTLFMAQHAGNTYASSGNDWLKLIYEKDESAPGSLVDVNGSLGKILAATQAGTAHGLVTAGQIQVVANRAHFATLQLATLQQYTLQGNARIVDVNTSVGKVNTSARDINASVGTVDASVQDVNASLGTVDTSVGDVNTSIGTLNATFGSGLAGVALAVGNFDTNAVAYFGSLDTNLTAALGAQTKAIGNFDSNAVGYFGSLDTNLTAALGAIALSIGSFDTNAVAYFGNLDTNLTAALGAISLSIGNFDTNAVEYFGSLDTNATAIGNLRNTIEADMVRAQSTGNALLLSGFEALIRSVDAGNLIAANGNQYEAATAFNTKILAGINGITSSGPPLTGDGGGDILTGAGVESRYGRFTASLPQPTAPSQPAGLSPSDIAPLVAAIDRLELAVRQVGATQAADAADGFGAVVTAVDGLAAPLKRLAAA